MVIRCLVTVGTNNSTKVDMRKDVWEVAATLPNHGQHYCNLFKTRNQAVLFMMIQQQNPAFAKVEMHKVSIKQEQYVYL